MKKYIEPNVKYPCTNESIKAAIVGLNLRKKDMVVSVAGSGDIALAIAPNVSKVYAVDSEARQIEFMKKQMSLLKNGNLKSFYHMALIFIDNQFNHEITESDLKRRKNYFSRNFSKIKGALSKIELITGDIFEVTKNLGEKGVSFDKIYLSNVIMGRKRLVPNSETFKQSMKALKKGGLIYETTHCTRTIEEIGDSFRLDNIRTDKAKNEMEEFSHVWGWIPQVYEKV